jgi:hypothetical protein
MTTKTTSSKKDIIKLIDPPISNVFNGKIVDDPNNIHQQLALQSKRLTESFKDVEASTRSYNEATKGEVKIGAELTLDDVERVYKQIGADNYEFSNIFNGLSREIALSKVSYNKVYTRYLPNINRSIYNLRNASRAPREAATPLDSMASQLSTYDIRTPTKDSYSDKFLNTSIWGASFVVKQIAKASGKVIINIVFTSAVSTFGAAPAAIGLVSGWFVIGVADTLSKNYRNPITDDYDRRLLAILSNSVGFMTLNMPYFVELPGVAGASLAGRASMTFLVPILTAGGKKLIPMTFKGLFVSNVEEDTAVKAAFTDTEDFDVLGLFQSLMVVGEEDNFRKSKLGRATSVFGIAALVPIRAKRYVDYVTERLSVECVNSLLDTSHVRFIQDPKFGRMFDDVLSSTRIPFMKPNGVLSYLIGAVKFGVKGALAPVTFVWNACLATIYALSDVLRWVNKTFGYTAALLLTTVVVPIMVLNLDAQYNTLIGDTVIGLFGAAVEATYNIVFTKDFLVDMFRTTAAPEFTARIGSPALYAGFEAIIGSFAVSGVLYGITGGLGENVYVNAMIVILTMCPVFISAMNRYGVTGWLASLPGPVGKLVTAATEKSAQVYGSLDDLTSALQEEVSTMMYNLGIVDRLDKLERWNGAKIECARWSVSEWAKVIAIEGVMIGKMNEQITDLFSLGVDKGVDYYNGETESFTMTVTEVRDSIAKYQQEGEEADRQALIKVDEARAKTTLSVTKAEEKVNEIYNDPTLVKLREQLVKLRETPDGDAVREQIAARQAELGDEISFAIGEVSRLKAEQVSLSSKRVALEKNQKLNRLTNDVLVEKILEYNASGVVDDADGVIQFESLYKQRGWGNQAFNMWLDMHSWWRKEGESNNVLDLYKNAVKDINDLDESVEIEVLLNKLEELERGEGGTKLSAVEIEELIGGWSKEGKRDARAAAEAKFPNADPSKIDRYCTDNLAAGCADFEVVVSKFAERETEINTTMKKLEKTIGTINNTGFVTGFNKIKYAAESVINQSTDLNRAARIAVKKDMTAISTTGLLLYRADMAVEESKQLYGDGTGGLRDLDVKKKDLQLRLLELEKREGEDYLPDRNKEIPTVKSQMDDLRREMGELDTGRIAMEFSNSSGLTKIEGWDRYARLNVKNMSNFMKQKNMEWVMGMRAYYRDGSMAAQKGKEQGIVWFPRSLDDLKQNAHGALSMTPTEVVSFTALGLIASGGGVVPFSTVFFLGVNRWMSQFGFTTPAIEIAGVAIPTVSVRGIDFMTRLGPLLRSTKSLVVDVIMKETKGFWTWVTELLYGQNTEITKEQQQLIEDELRRLKNKLFTISQTKKKLNDIYNAQMKELDEATNLSDDDRAMLKALCREQNNLATSRFEDDTYKVTNRYASRVLSVSPYVSQLSGRSGRADADVAVDHAMETAINLQTEIDIILSLDIDIDTDTAIAYGYGGDGDDDDISMTSKKRQPPVPVQPVDDTVDSKKRVLVNGANAVKWNDQSKRDAIMPKNVQAILDRYIEEEEDIGRRNWMKTNYLWAGMEARPYDELKNISVDPYMLISMFRKVQFESIQDMALNSEGYTSVIDFERNAEERFYTALALSSPEGGKSWWPVGGIWVDGQWRSDGSGKNEATLLGREEPTKEFGTYDNKSFEELKAEGRYIPEAEYEIGGFKFGGGDGVAVNRAFDKFGLGSGDAVRLSDRRMLDMINLEKAEDDKFTSVNDFYKALKFDGDSDRVKVNWGNRILLELLSDETPGVSLEYLDIARNHEVEVRNWDSTRQIDTAASNIGRVIDRWQPIASPGELNAIMSPFTGDEGKRLWTDRGSGAWESAEFTRDYITGQNDLATELGSKDVEGRVLKSGMYGVISGAAYGLAMAQPDEPFSILGGITGGAIIGGVGGVLYEGRAAAGFTNSVGSSWINGLEYTGENTWEGVHLSDVYASERNPPYDANAKREGGDYWFVGPLLKHPIVPDFSQNKERYKRAAGQSNLASRGYRLGQIPLGKREDFGDSDDIKLGRSTAIERETAITDFAKLEEYMTRSSTITRAELPIAEQTSSDKIWLASYQIANDLYKSIKTRDALVENYYRRNEAWQKYPELIIDESFVHTPKNQVANFRGAFHYKNFVREDLMRDDLF